MAMSLHKGYGSERERSLASELEEERMKNSKLLEQLASKDQRIKELEAELRQAKGESAPSLSAPAVVAMPLGVSESSQQSLEESESSQQPSTLSDEIWDECAINFYDLLCVDPTVQRFFRGTKLSSLKKGQWCFFRSLWNGEDMEMDSKLHRIWDITDQDFDRFLGIFKQVLSVHASETSIAEFLKRLESFRDKVVRQDSKTTRLTSRSISEEMTETPEDLAEYLKELFTSELQDDPALVPPDCCLQQMAKHLKEAYHLKRNQSLSASHLQAPHSQSYISSVRTARLREILSAHPTLGKPPVMKAWDDAVLVVSDKLNTRSQQAKQRRERGQSSLTNSVTILSTVNMWYAKMKRDGVLSAFFERRSSSSAEVARRQFDFIHRMALASKMFQEEHQADHLRAIHRPLVIKDSHFDRFVSCLMDCCKHNQNLHDDFASFIEQFRPVVVQRCISKHDGKDSCPVTGNSRASGNCPFQSTFP